MLSEKARQKRNEYYREYYKKNRERIHKQREEFWERKVLQMEQEAQKDDSPSSDGVKEQHDGGRD